jgi:hypothetical protein
MSQSAKVVPIRPRARREGPRAEVEEPAPAGEERREGALVALARLLELGASGLTWENVARAWSAFYFSWHSEEVDEFGFDRKFTETLRPFFEFLYTVWWRVEASGLENVPSEGRGLIVANHSGVLPYDGLMVNVAIRHEHPARRDVRMLALVFQLPPPTCSPKRGRAN